MRGKILLNSPGAKAHGGKLYGVGSFAWRFWKTLLGVCTRCVVLHGNRKIARRCPVCMKIRKNWWNFVAQEAQCMSLHGVGTVAW